MVGQIWPVGGSLLTPDPDYHPQACFHALTVHPAWRPAGLLINQMHEEFCTYVPRADGRRLFLMIFCMEEIPTK